MHIKKVSNVSRVSRVKLDQSTFRDSKNPLSNLDSPKPSLSSKQFNDDTVSISDEAKKLLAEEQLAELNEKTKYYKELFDQLDDVSNDDNPYADDLKVLQIAMRIIAGDNVPSKDERFLAEKDPAMYGRALLLRRQKDDPKDYKSLLEDKKDDIESEGASLIEDVVAVVEASLEVSPEATSETES